jgi:EpsI family protein
MKLKSTAGLMAALMCCVSILGVAARPDIKEQPNFLATVPETFGEWTIAEHQVSQIIDPATDELLKRIYKEVLSRTYVNKAGYKIMLSIARSGNQIGIQQAHFPEICYPAQGFTVSKIEDGELMTPYGPINVRRLTTSMRARYEPVTYWLTMGDQVVRTQWDKRLVQIRAVLTRESPGGLLFRISSIDKDSEAAFAVQQKFAADLMQSVPPEARRKLGGLTSPSPL